MHQAEKIPLQLSGDAVCREVLVGWDENVAEHEMQLKDEAEGSKKTDAVVAFITVMSLMALASLCIGTRKRRLSMTRNASLLQIVDSLNAGGMENIVVEVCNRLDPARFKVTVCCLSGSGPFARRLRPEVRVVALEKPSGFSWQAVRALRNLLKTGAYDVVHTHHLGGLIYAALARGCARRPRIVHSEHIILHDWELERRRLWQRWLLYRAAQCVFTVSSQQMDQLRCLRLRHPHMFTLTNGVDGERFQPSPCSKQELRRRLGLPEDGLLLGKVARFATAKRHGALIEAFERATARRPDLRLLLLGDGGIEQENVLARIAASPAKNRIHWAGLQQDPAPWYQAMDVLVIASDQEGLPNAALEGMACGLPLLANAACGVREVAQDGEHGWIGDFSTVARLAAALDRVAGLSPDDLQKTGAAAAGHVHARFSMAGMLEKYDRLYTAVAAGKKALP